MPGTQSVFDKFYLFLFLIISYNRKKMDTGKGLIMIIDTIIALRIDQVLFKLLYTCEFI